MGASSPSPRVAATSRLAAVLVERLQADVVYEGTDLAMVMGIDPLPDVVLLDLDLGTAPADPVLAGRLQDAGCRVLVVSAMADPDLVAQMLRAGVSGFVNKSESPEELVKAIRYVLADGVWTSPEVAALVVDSVPRPELSPTQVRVLTLYASGMTLESVARSLGISPGTASTHLKRARAKYAALGRPAGSRVDLYRTAVADRIIEA
jgi:DNA-binding NarL/FixJ family response regulator